MTGVIAATFLIMAVLLVRPDLTREVIIAIIVLGTVSLILELGIDFPLLISGSTSFSTVSYMAMIFLLPFPIPPIIGGIVIFLSDLRGRKSWIHLVFNSSNYILTFGVSSLIWHLYSDGRTLQTIPRSLVPLLVISAIIIVFYALNVFTLNGYLAIANRRPVSYIWVTQDLDFLLPYISLEVIGVLVAVVWSIVPSVIPLLIVPAVTTYIAFETIQRLQRQTQEAMLAMADAIDARDPYTAEHSRRVASLARRIAEVQGLRLREVERIELAARVHDIGKIGISNTTLHKEGPLSENEWSEMQQHPLIGEELLRPYRQFRHEVAMVRSHHERWDGGGYPDGLRGQAIPIGARVISVADTFDAMTSDRPYRPALNRSTAVAEIQRNALSQFDPQVVASFLQVMEEADKVRPLQADAHQDQGDQERPWYSLLQ